MQDYSFDRALGTNTDLSKQNAARDPRLIRDFVRDNRLNTQLHAVIYAAGDVLRAALYAKLRDECS